MPYEVLFKPAADRDLAKINPADRSRILQKIASLQEDPRPPGSRKLHGPQNIYRLRSGN